MILTTTAHDVAEHLCTPKEQALYLQASMVEASDDAAFIAKTLGDIARAWGMAQVAQAADMPRASLYKGMSGEWQRG